MAKVTMIAVFAATLAMGTASAQTTAPEQFKFLTPGDMAGQIKADHGSIEMSDRGEFKSQYVDRLDTGNSVEVHDHWAHYIDVISGDGVVTVGGTVVGSKKVSPGEFRGTSIDGGKTVTVHPGDYLQIPAGMPHLMKAATPGGHLRYFLMNIHQ